MSVITTVWIVTHEYLFQRLEHLNLEVKVTNLTQKGVGKNDNNKEKQKQKLLEGHLEQDSGIKRPHFPSLVFFAANLTRQGRCIMCSCH